jgi:ATP-dependent Clp protease ATP-binding subunit ClpA
VKEHPFSLVLLDEFEKAHPDILNLFLQVFDDGRLTDNKGKTVSFADCIMIATSNAGAEYIREAVNSKTPLDTKFQQQLLEQLQKNGMFKPELLNRFDAIVMFKPLSDADMVQVAKLMLADVIKSMNDKDITLFVDEKVLAKLITEGIDPEFGARPLRRFIQDKIDDVLAKQMLSDKIGRGNNVMLTTDEQNNITAVVS